MLLLLLLHPDGRNVLIVGKAMIPKVHVLIESSLFIFCVERHYGIGIESQLGLGNLVKSRLEIPGMEDGYR